MEGLDHVEYLPEPHDRSIVSAVDPAVVGHQDGWRSEVMGWAPMVAQPVVRARRRALTATNMLGFAVFVSISMLLWQNDLLVVDIPLPDSEWAFEATGVLGLNEDGLSGKGIRLCMVDTGIDNQHEAFAGKDIRFHDLIGDSSAPREYGAVAHGTLMAGILISGSHQAGIAQNVTFAMVAALQDDGSGQNSGLESDVGDAIRWCQFQFEADIISLSLGGTPNMDGQREGDSVSATRQATDSGIFVVAAAGNDGGSGDDGDVAAPGNVPRAISVGATTRQGQVWVNSSVGSDTGDETPRQHPHMKPEIVAPGHRIISTGEENLWYTSSGTSDSTVFVAGALALLLEAHPQLRPDGQSDGSCVDLVKTALMNSAQSIGQGEDHHPYAGYGQVDARAWIDEIKPGAAC